MSFLGTCPQCSVEIPKDRYISGFAICECGWCDTTGLRRDNKKNEKKTIHAMVAATVVTIGLFAHLATWGSYAVEIPVTKVRQMTGTLSKQGYLELADACIGLGRFECAKSAYTELHTDLGDASGLAFRAKLEERLGETSTALMSYTSYFKAGGKDSLSFVSFGRLLEGANRTDEAFQSYENAIATSGELLPVQATTGIVRLLMKQGRYEESLERIKAFHQSAGNAIGYLNTELAQLEQYLGAQAKATSKTKSKKTTSAAGKKLAKN